MLKKFLCVKITVLLVLSLLGCTQTNDAPSTEDAPSTKIVAVAAGDSFSFAIEDNGVLWAWGRNLSGQLGDGTATKYEERTPFSRDPWIISVDNNRHSPIKIMYDVVSISAGFSHTTAITADGSLWAWGSYGTTEYSHLPVKIMEDVISVSAGFNYTMAITADGGLWAWGWNISGQLGDGTGGHARYDKDIPVKIMGDVVSVSAGSRHTMAITTDGSLWAWGWNSNGQLGDGTKGEDRHSPVKIMDDVVSVSAGVYHTMAIRTDGSLWGWGANWNGELGDGTIDTREWNEEEGFWFFNNRPTPTKIMDSVASVSAGQSHTMAIMTDGSLWAWGYGYGIFPQKIMDSAAMVSTALHTIALQIDGSVWAWGRNDFGQLGDGTTIDRATPVKIIDSAMLTE